LRAEHEVAVAAVFCYGAVRSRGIAELHELQHSQSTMRLLVLLFALFAGTMGVLAMLFPTQANHVARLFRDRGGLYAATAIRLVFGAAILFAANASRAPMTLRIFGALILITGLLVPVLGLERHRRMLDWWLESGRTIQVAWGLLALAISAFLVYSVV
jgi:hypothetical protein